MPTYARLVKIALLALLGISVASCGGGVSTSAPSEQLDQQNLLSSASAGQGIGRFNDLDGAPDPTGTSFDFRDAQTFTVGVTGRLTGIRCPIFNGSSGIESVLVVVVGTVGGVPEGTNVLGSATIPAAALPSDTGALADPAQWAFADFSGSSINVTAGDVLAFTVRTMSTVGYLYPLDLDGSYTLGSGFRRNAAVSPTWGEFGDFAFQTFVTP